MGERILQRQEELRASVTFKREYMDKLERGTRFYHPLPRHRANPTIPQFLDETELNGWERQSINGMYVRIVLLALLAGRLGDDFSPTETVAPRNDEEYIIEVDPVQTGEKEGADSKDQYSEGVRPIRNGIVIDHICKGDDPATIRRHMALIVRILGLDGSKGGEWVSTSTRDSSVFKGIIFRPGAGEFTRKDLKRLAAVAAGCTLNIIKDGRVSHKYRTHLPPRIYNFNDIGCANDACISHISHAENAPARFIRTDDGRYACEYCGRLHTFKEIWK
jgi:aspartate carbamoyltransferase